MKWFQNIFTAIALMNLVISPVAHAVEWTAKDKAQIAQYREYLEPLGYSLTLDKTSKKALVYDKNTNKLIMDIPFAEEAQLRKYSPKNLNQLMLNEMVRVKTASKASWSHSVRGLPTESAIFFVAMGAVVAGQLITNYSQNPVAMKQHIDHSLSPLGVFGFFTFMYSQGVTSNVLSMYMKNPKFHHMIPYLGMTVGAFLQTYLSQIASDPNVKACAKVMIGKPVSQKDLESGVDQDPCSKAYEYLVVQKKVWEFAPGIVSMLISSGLAGVAQSVISKTVLRVTGVDIALWLIPGGMQIKGVRLLLVKGLQITFFVGIDVWLNRQVTYVWKNMFDGADFYDQNDRLNEQMNLVKQNNWSGDDTALQAEIKDFRQKMTGWRMMNMSEVYEAHQSWQESLHQLTSMFNSSFAFYNSVVNEVRTARFDGAETPLASKFPLSGVVAKDLNEGKEDLYLTNPGFLQSGQMETVTDAATALSQALSSDAQYFLPHEMKALTNVASLLASGDINKAEEGILALEKIKENADINMSVSSEYRQLIRKVWASLGNPTPAKGVGQGFMSAYEKAPSSAESLKGTSYYRISGAFQTPKITDYLVMQMLCGPDVEAGESSIRNSLGYPSVFMPPTIKNANDSLIACDALGANLPSDQIYNFEMRTNAGKTYQGAVSYLLKEARPSVVGSKDADAFANWWLKNTESQMSRAFEEYTKSYDNIVVKLVKAIYYPGRSIFNGRPIINSPWKNAKLYFSSKDKKRLYEGGPIFNGGMNSAFQEERVYLALLEDIMKPSKEFNVEIAKILEKAPTHPALVEVDKQFAILNGLIKRVKIGTEEGREVIKSDLENYELEEQLQNIQAALTKVSTVLGVGDDTTGAQFKVNKQQRDLAVTALELLQGLASEVMMYGSMANAVSWDKIRNLKRINMEQQQFNNDIQAKLNAMRGMSMTKH